MADVWLRGNSRALWFGVVPPALLGAVGACLASGVFGRALGDWPRWLGYVLLVPSALVCGALLWQMRQPRLACDGENLLVYLRTGPPIRVPLEVVECFLVGQGPALLPGKSNRKAESANIVVRLSPKAEQWRRVEVRPQLGAWCDSHITIRGTWCETITPDLLRRLNANLGQAQRALAKQEAP